jgi:hypothetical protein
LNDSAGGFSTIKSPAFFVPVAMARWFSDARLQWID